MHDDTASETAGGEKPPPAPAQPPTGPPPEATPAPETPTPDTPAPDTPAPDTPAPDTPVAVASEEAALSRAAAELDQVEAALARLEDGSSDVCQVCGGAIGRECLLQNPLLTRCAEHAPRHEMTGEA